MDKATELVNRLRSLHFNVAVPFCAPIEDQPREVAQFSTSLNRSKHAG